MSPTKKQKIDAAVQRAIKAIVGNIKQQTLEKHATNKYYVYYSYEPDYGDLTGFKDLKTFETLDEANNWIADNRHYNITGPLTETK
jgi:hypothetical protein